MSLKTVYIELVAETKDLLAGFKKVDKKTSAMTRSFRRMGAALLGVFGARALFRGFNQTLKSTEALIKTAKGVGFTANEYQRLAFVLSEVGVEASSARIAIGDFQKRLSKAVGGSSPQFAKAFKEAGLDIRALSKMDPAAAFWSAFDRLADQLDDPRIAGLFGNVFEEQSGKDMLKAARQLGLLVQARKDYDRVVGRGLTREDAKNIEATGRQTRLLGLRFADLKQKAVIDTLPKLEEALVRLEKADAFGKMAKGIVAVVNGISMLISKFEEMRALGYEFQEDYVFHKDPGTKELTKDEQKLVDAQMQKRAEWEARRLPGIVHSPSTRRGTSPLAPRMSPNAGGITHYNIEQVFHLVKEKDTPRKAGQQVEDVVSREVAGP
jgi:hypothetical protein